MTIPFLHIIVGLLITVALGLLVPHVLAYAGKSISLDPPSGASDEQKREWKKLMKGNESGAVLGFLERLIFFAAFFAQAHIAVAAWLAFKVASKWNAWENVIAIPDKLEGIENLSFLVARRNWGSHVLMTFLIGTACNILAGLLGASVATHWTYVSASLGL
jgi:hypothetical protein